MTVAEIPLFVCDPIRLAALAAYDILDTPAEDGFDDIVRLVTRLCDTPVALVSLVAEDRQWFKARINFSPTETDLERSVCAHALAAHGLLIIPDLTSDARTCENPLVTGAPHLRFYAGAPLRTREGLVLGTLCAIDTVGRPAGLTPDQARDLTALARQVVTLLELRRTLAAREADFQRHDASLRERSAQLRTQQIVSSSGGNLDIILDALVAGALEAIPAAEGGALELIDGDALDYRSVRGSLAEFQGLRAPIADSLSGACARTNEALLVGDVIADDRANQELVARLKLRSAVLAPVARGTEVLGVLTLQSSQRNAFSAHDLELAKVFAQIATTGLTAASEVAAQRAVKTSEAKLKLERGLLETILEQVPIGVSIVQADGHAALNRRAIEMMGHTVPDGLERYADLRAFHPDGRRYEPTEFPSVRALMHGETITREPMIYQGVGPGAARRWEISSTPIREGGTIRAAVSVMLDVEDQLRDREALVAKEAYWHGLFEQLREGFVLGRVVRNAAGTVIDWRYEEVNQAWSDLIGIPAEAALGRTVRELIPAIEDGWITDVATVVETGRSVTFVRQVGALQRWYEGRVHRIGPDAFMMLFLEITDRVLAEQERSRSESRKAALVELGDRLRDLDNIPDLARVAAEVVGNTLHVSRAAFGLLDAAAETLTIETDWTAPGMASVAGVHRLEHYGDLRTDMLRGEPLVLHDVRTDPRTAHNAAILIDVGVLAAVNTTVYDRGRTVALFIVHQNVPRQWTDEEVKFLRTAADRVEVGVSRLQSEAQQRLVNREITHRLKNNLALVQAVVTQTLRNSVDLAQARETLTARIAALSNAHDNLVSGQAEGASVTDVIRDAAKAHADQPDRIYIEGPPLQVGPRIALSLALMIHELATNAAKYGALSLPGGSVAIAWLLSGPLGDQVITLVWQERDGPRITAPSRTGFGSRLIERGLAGMVGGTVTMDYAPEGLCCTMVAPLASFLAID